MRVEVAAVQDGDSLIVRPHKSGGQMRVRLFAIDAPEFDQQHGDEAREYLRRLVSGRSDLVLEPVATDRYGRQVAILYYRGTGRSHSVNRMMVEQGMARWYRRYGGHGLGLEQAEENARRRRRGVWAARGQVAPWEHRRAQRESAERGSRLKWLLAGAIVGTVVGVVLLWLIFD